MRWRDAARWLGGRRESGFVNDLSCRSVAHLFPDASRKRWRAGSPSLQWWSAARCNPNLPGLFRPPLGASCGFSLSTVSKRSVPRQN